MENKLKMIGHRIKCLRMESNVSQSSMANKIGMSQTNLSNIESGRTTATIPVLFKIQKVLGCKMADFFVDFDGAEEQDSASKNVGATKKVEATNNAIELEDAVQILKLLKAVEIKGL